MATTAKNTNKKLPIIRSIDLGFGFTKYDHLDPETGEIEYSSFPSLAPRASNTDMSAGILGRRDTVVVDVDGTKYEIGPDSTDLETSDVVRALNDSYIFTDQYKALTLGALHYINEEEIDLLVVGLPVSNLHQASDLHKILKGEHKINDEKTVNVKEVLVLAQPIGGLYYCMKCLDNEDFEDLKEEKNLIIDPGFLTFDFVLANGDKPNENKSDSKPGGVSKILEAIAKSISEKFKIRYDNLSAIDKGLRKSNRKIKISGKPEPLEEHIKNTKSVLESSITYMTNLVGDGSDIDNIIVVGGGAKIFEKAIKAHYPEREIHIIENSQYANVKGYQQAGEEHYKKFLSKGA
jgi:plasmid segregation protein ParM